MAAIGGDPVAIPRPESRATPVSAVDDPPPEAVGRRAADGTVRDPARLAGPTPSSMLRAATSSLVANSSPAPGVSAETLNRVERAGGSLATRSVAMMDERLPWFRSLPPEQRSWVTLVAQAGISGYVIWARSPGAEYRITGEVFGTAPRDLVRAVSLRRTVELLRIAITVAEEDLPALAADAAETVALRDSLLRYSREVAFAAASVYAAAAETRGAWDARVEAAVVDGIVRGEDFGSLSSRAAALDWDPTVDTLVVAGAAPAGDRAEAVAAVAEWAASASRAAMAGVHGDRLVLVLAGSAPPGPEIEDLFGDGPVVRGRPGTGLREAVVSAADALAGLDVAAAWPAAPRTIDADDLLTERVLGGDPRAAARLRAAVYAPLAAAPAPLLTTIEAYLATGGALEPTARNLFVHPNTVRYRLHKIADLTGRDPWEPRDLLVLQTAVILGRLAQQP
ncbi:MAG TPA: helix-turn-helix domain-containing protein [Nakamurella sp.]